MPGAEKGMTLVEAGGNEIVIAADHGHLFGEGFEGGQRMDPAIAVLSRTKAPLAAIRTALEDAACPFSTTLEKGFPLQRVREMQVTLNWLATRKKENARASDMVKALGSWRNGWPSTNWRRMIDGFFENYREDTDDSILPIDRTIDSLYEFIAEQRREKVIGQGVFLSTIHSAKGMEFPHVLVLDGDWQPPIGPSQREEERRVMYVGMTRAKETLHLLKIARHPNRFSTKSRATACFH